MTAREDVLGRIRVALGPAPVVPDVPRAYERTRTGDRLELFAERVADYRATVRRVAADELAAAVAELCGTRVIVPRDWGVAGVEAVADGGDLGPRDLERFDTALTGCALAIAETGTIVLDCGPASGRRALTLVPDHHVCVVRAQDVVGTVPEAIAALSSAASDGRPITFVSGPSATSDIELERVEGVHGPRRLDVVLVI
jgi:L-lactate dehydrogenase complex protein LldG